MATALPIPIELLFVTGMLFWLNSAHAQSSALSVELQSSKNTVEPEEHFVYTVTVRNQGTSDTTTNVILTLDSRMEVASASHEGRTRRDTVEWEEQRIPAGSSQSFTAVVRAEEGTTDTTILRSTAIADTGFSETEVQVEDRFSTTEYDDRAVTVELFSNKGSAEPGAPIIFIIKLQNRDDRQVENIETLLHLDKQLEFLSASNDGEGSDGGTIRWSSLTLQPQEIRTLTSSVRLSESARNGESIISTITAEGASYEHRIDVHDPQYRNGAMELHGFAEQNPVEPGASLSYTIRVRNRSGAEEELDIHTALDTRMSFKAASGNGAQFEERLVKWERIRFAPDETQSFTLSVQIKEGAAHQRNPLRLAIQVGNAQKEIFVEVVPPKASAKDTTTQSADSPVSSNGEPRTSPQEEAHLQQPEDVTPLSEEQSFVSPSRRVVLEFPNDAHNRASGQFVASQAKYSKQIVSSHAWIERTHAAANPATIIEDRNKSLFLFSLYTGFLSGAAAAWKHRRTML